MRSERSISGFALFLGLWAIFASSVVLQAADDAAPSSADLEKAANAQTNTSQSLSAEELGLPPDSDLDKAPVQPMPEQSPTDETQLKVRSIQPDGGNASNSSPVAQPPTGATASNDDTSASPGSATDDTQTDTAAALQSTSFSEAGESAFDKNGGALTSSTEEDAPHHFHLSLMGGEYNDLQSNGSYNFVGFDFQITLNPHWATGILATICSGSSEVVAATLNYYSRRPYEGIWIQLGVGPQFVIPGLTIGAVPVFATMGWRWLEETRNLTFGFGIGPTLYPFSTPSTWGISARIDIGLAWNIFPH